MADMPSNPPAGGPINPPAADNEPTISPEADFLLTTRELIIEGRSIYGDPNSRLAKERLAEIDANLTFLRGIGEAPPAPEPWSPERVARVRLAAEFPSGDPGAATAWGHKRQREFVASKVAALGALGVREQADLHQKLVDDLGSRANEITGRYSIFNQATNSYPTGSQILEALLKDAEPAILAHTKAGEVQKTRDALKLDRSLLERFTVMGRNITNYQAAKARYGVK
jgi:hypothetical protein